jgi:hypothetical protein
MNRQQWRHNMALVSDLWLQWYGGGAKLYLVALRGKPA